MSERNVELFRRFVKAFNARDIEAMIAQCDPSIEFHSTFAAVGGAVYHGLDGLRDWHRDLADAWREIRVEPGAYFDLGQDTLLVFVLHARGRHSRAEVAMPIASVTSWRDGLMIYFKNYTQRDDALSDLGVSEDELEPIDP